MLRLRVRRVVTDEVVRRLIRERVDDVRLAGELCDQRAEVEEPRNRGRAIRGDGAGGQRGEEVGKGVGSDRVRAERRVRRLIFLRAPGRHATSNVSPRVGDAQADIRDHCFLRRVDVAALRRGLHVLHDARCGVDPDGERVAGRHVCIADGVARSTAAGSAARQCPTAGFEQRVQHRRRAARGPRAARRKDRGRPTPVASLNPLFPIAPPMLNTTPFCVITMNAPSVACASTVCLMSVFDAAPMLDTSPVSTEADPVAPPPSPYWSGFCESTPITLFRPVFAVPSPRLMTSAFSTLLLVVADLGLARPRPGGSSCSTRRRRPWRCPCRRSPEPVGVQRTWSRRAEVLMPARAVRHALRGVAGGVRDTEADVDDERDLQHVDRARRRRQ